MPAKKRSKSPKPKINLLARRRLSYEQLPELKRKAQASTEFRRNLVEAQNRANFVNEYHRLNGYIATHTIPTLAAQQTIKERMEELKQLTKDSFNNKIPFSSRNKI